MSTPIDVIKALGLEIMVVDVDTIDPNPWNPNVMDKRTFEAARESIRTYGFIDPVTVRPHPDEEGRWQIIDGEHRWRGAKEEGLTEVSIASTGPLSDAKAKNLTIIFNETRGEADMALMGKLLVELERELGDDGPVALPFSESQMRHLRQLADEDWDKFQQAGDGLDKVGEEEESHALVLSFAEGDYEKVLAFLTMLAHEWQEEPSMVVLRLLDEAVQRVREEPAA